MIKIINRILKPFRVKLLKTTDVFDWCGETYYLPLKPWKDSAEWMQDSRNNVIPIKFTNEEDRNFCIRAVNRALSNDL